MNKKAERDFGEVLEAILNGNGERAGRILARLPTEHRIKLAKGLGKTFGVTLLCLTPGEASEVLDEVGFEIAERSCGRQTARKEKADAYRDTGKAE